MLDVEKRRRKYERKRETWGKAGTWRREREREDFLWDAGHGCRRLDRVPTFGRGQRGHAQSGARQGGELPWGAGQWARRPRGRRVDHCLSEHLHLDEVTPACAKVAELWGAVSTLLYSQMTLIYQRLRETYSKSKRENQRNQTLRHPENPSQRVREQTRRRHAMQTT